MAQKTAKKSPIDGLGPAPGQVATTNPSSAILGAAAGLLGGSTADALDAKLANWVQGSVGHAPSREDLDRIKSLYNANPDNATKIGSDADLIGVLNSQSPQAQAAVLMSVAGVAHQETAIPLGNGRTVRIPADAYTAIQQVWGDAAGHLPLVAHMAAMHGDATGRLIPLIVAAGTATGVFGQAGNARVDRPVPGGQGPATTEGLRHHTIDSLAEALPRLYQQYGDYTLALIATKYQPIADKLKAGTPLTGGEQQQTRQFLLDARYDDSTMAKAGLAVDSHELEQISNAVGGLGGRTPNAGRQAPSIVLPNVNDVKDGLATVWKAWFQSNPSDAQLASFAHQVNAAAASYSERSVTPGSTVTAPGNLATQAEAFARAQPQYADLFGKKPANLDETTYASEFSRAAQGQLGDVGAGDVAAIQAGMRTGKTETTASAAAYSPDAFHNATFLERLANAAQAIGRVT